MDLKENVVKRFKENFIVAKSYFLLFLIHLYFFVLNKIRMDNDLFNKIGSIRSKDIAKTLLLAKILRRSGVGRSFELLFFQKIIAT